MLKKESIIPRISRGEISETYVGTALCIIPVANPTTIYRRIYQRSTPTYHSRKTDLAAQPLLPIICDNFDNDASHGEEDDGEEADSSTESIRAVGWITLALATKATMQVPQLETAAYISPPVN
jgi:hypothetical protein